MSLYTILLGVQYASIVLMLFMCAYITVKWNKPLHGWLFFYCMATLGNNATYLAIMLSRTENAAVLAQQIAYLFRAWIPFAILHFLLFLCKVKKHMMISNILALFHTVTYFLVLTLRHHRLYYTSFRFVEEGLFPHLEHTNGIWYHFNAWLIISYGVVGLWLLIPTMHREKNARKKKQFFFVTAAIIADLVFYVLTLMKAIPGYDLTVLGYTVAAVFLYIAILHYDMLDTKELARDFVVEHVSEGIIAMNEDGSISFYNEKAKNLLPSLGDSPETALAEVRQLIMEEKPLVVRDKKYTPKENLLELFMDCPKWHRHGAGKVYVLTDDTKHYQYAEKLTREMMLALSKAVDAKDHYTNGHSTRVAHYAKEIARRMGKSAEEQEQIYEMGLLHDVGKIGVSEDIINKTSRLTDEEFAQIKMHTTKGYDILHQISSMPELSIGARSHHEKFNGTGYPDGLKGTEIPEAARIICVADCYDAMTSTRTYSTPKPQETVRAEFERCSGTQFDPAIAKIMIAMIDDDKDYRMNERGMA